MLSIVIIVSALVGLIAFTAKTLLSNRVSIPEHLLHHPAGWLPNLIGPEENREINEIMREFKDFPTNVNAGLKHVNFTMMHEHVGEAIPVDEHGRCNDPYLVPSIDGTLCVFPTRIDIGRHFILTGGPDAIREPMEAMVSRVSSFARYLFNTVDYYPPIKRLFEQENFQRKAQEICPKDQQILDPFQFSFILQVPGQSVPLHTDSPYFYGASRKQYPEWLLACMVFSRLFESKFINQVQVVGYLHDWVPKPDEFDKKYNASDPSSMVTSSDGGDFVYYDEQDENPKVIVPYPRSGSFIDGSKAIHAAKVYKKGVQAPFLDKSKNNTLVYQGKHPNGTETELWHLVVNGETTAVYRSEDVRMTIVYRARCFAKPEDVQRFYAQTDKDVMPLDYILDRLKYGMQKDRENVPADIRDINPVKTAKKHTRAELDAMSRYTLGLAMIDYYLSLPLPPTTITWMPYNYCALSGLYPFTKPLLDLIC